MINFGEERVKLLERVRKAEPGKKALLILNEVRENFDCAIEDYNNVLHLLSDNAYKDRRHFLLELIQNADDAFYDCETSHLAFYINNDSLELKYNEKGFSVEDVIAITGAGISTKKDRMSHGFIGEKGIGFKSVFALASKVEIISPPWSFYLMKEKPIIPYPLENEIDVVNGSYIRIMFLENSSLDIIAKELKRFVSGEIESFLFLQKLAEISVIDNRVNPPEVAFLKIEPPDRKSTTVYVETFPGQDLREYTLYEDDAVFPAKLVSERWERLGLNTDIKRKILAAALVEKTDEKYLQGRLFCSLCCLSLDA